MRCPVACLLLSCVASEPLGEEYAEDTQERKLQAAWKAYLTIDDVEYDTAKGACVACGIAGGDREHISCFEEAIAEGCIGRMLRQLFVTLITNTDGEEVGIVTSLASASLRSGSVRGVWREP